MVDFSQRTLEEKIPYAANSTKSIKIPRDRFIQKIMLRLHLVGDTGTVTAAEDAAAGAIVKAIRLVANGNDTKFYVSFPDLHYENWYEYGTRPDNFISTTNAQTDVVINRSQADICFMIDRKNPFELPAMLPAHQLSSLELFVDFGAASDLGTGYTVDTSNAAGVSEIEVTLRECDLTSADIRQVSPFLAIKESAIEKTIDAAYSDYTFAVDLPVGGMLRKTALTAIRAGVRSDIQVPKYLVRQESPIRREILQATWEASQRQDKVEYGIETVLGGYTVLDYETIGRGGLDLRALKEGDVKLKMNALTPSGTTKVRLVNQEIF